MNIFDFRMNYRRLVLGVIFAIAAYTIYLLFYDTLIPGLPQGSFRLANPTAFYIASFLLVSGQIMIGGFLLNMLAAVMKKGEMDALKGYFIASAMTLLFAFTYAIFHGYGPFYYIVYFAGIGPWYALPFEIVWSVFAVVIGTVLVNKEYKLSMNHALLFSAIVYIFITVGAS